MRERALLFFVLAALTGASVAVLPALAAAPSETKLEVNENCNDPHWPCWAVPGSGSKPPPASKITIAAGGEVSFSDSATTKVNIGWIGTAPACAPSVPVSPAAPQTGWEGKCKFEQPGTYHFESSTLFNAGPGLDYTKYEVVVEAATTGTTPTTTGPTTTTTAPPPTETVPGYGPPAEGVKALKLAVRQRGSIVRGSLEVPTADSGGRLEVALFATGASLSKGNHAKLVRVGRLVRSSLKTGSDSFSVSLNAQGKAAVRHHRRLTLTVKITLAPLQGADVTATRSVVVHA